MDSPPLELATIAQIADELDRRQNQKSIFIFKADEGYAIRYTGMDGFEAATKLLHYSARLVGFFKWMRDNGQ